jgi:NAD(P)-dependent dehydrogenase (short-subunit alcohol dehydrogenase family)
MHESFNISGYTALVTGAGRGIGRACALGLAHAGARVIAVARTPSDLESLRLTASGDVECWCEDVTTESFYDRVEALNGLDILVNNAGMNRPLPIETVDPSTLDAMLALNVRALFRTSQSAVRVMLRGGKGGSIIHMSSQMGHVGASDRTVYCMTKHAVEGLPKALAVEVAHRGIRVNSVAPTFVETPMTQPMFEDASFLSAVLNSIPIGRIGTPQDVVGAVLFLASAASGMVTGDSIRVDGGWTAR